MLSFRWYHAQCNPLLHSLLIYVHLVVLLLFPSPSKYLSNAICDCSLHVRSQRPVCTKCTHAIWNTSKEPYSRVLLILKSIDLYVVSDIVCYFWMSYIGIFLSFSSLYHSACWELRNHMKKHFQRGTISTLIHPHTFSYSHDFSFSCLFVVWWNVCRNITISHFMIDLASDSWVKQAVRRRCLHAMFRILCDSLWN